MSHLGTLCPHLAFCPDPDMTSYGGVRICRVPLDAEVSERILSKDRLGVQICRHETTVATQSLKR